MIELTQAQFWILNTAADCGVSLRLIRADRAGYYFDDYHGLDNDGLVDVLAVLFDEGYLAAEYSDDSDDTRFVPDRHMILQSINQGLPKLSYWLTPKGGEAWEELAKPDWSRFVVPDMNDGDEHLLFGGSDDAIDEYIRFCIPNAADVTEISRAKLLPWEATYWKTLDRGCERRVRLSETAETAGWWVSTVMNWYTLPERFLPFAPTLHVEW